MNLWKKTTATALIASLCLSATVQVFAEKTSKIEETPTQTVNIVAEETNKENVESKTIEDTKEKQEENKEVVAKKKATPKKENVEKKSTTKKKSASTKKSTKKSSAKKSTKKESKKVNLGTFKVYAYSSGGITASGARTKANHTVAVDPKVIPLGSKIMVNGKVYKAEDTGGAIKGKKLDIYMPSESDCINWGVRNCTVYLLK